MVTDCRLTPWALLDDRRIYHSLFLICLFDFLTASTDLVQITLRILSQS